MAPNSWRQWAKLTKKQLRELGRIIDVELGNVIERHLPRQSSRLVRIPVPVRHTAPKFGASTILSRGYHQSAKSATGRANQFINSRLNQSAKFLNTTSRVTMFSSSPRIPRGVPRGLFANWNLCARTTSQRMYSTASIKFTHEAVNNMAISLRCFFNSLDGLAPPSNRGQSTASLSEIPHGQLRQKDISLIRDLQMFEMIQFHKEQAQLCCVEEDQLCCVEEDVGSYIEFKVPPFEIQRTMPSMSFANSVTLDMWGDQILQYTSELKLLGHAVRRIYENYGSLPITTTRECIRIHFPTLTMQETEKLVTELGITIGCVYPDADGLENDVLSNLDANTSCTFSSVLSRSPSIVSNDYAFV